ncbi:Uracil-DNA glycosylase [Psilocybe cubensis]|uniref:Uracil-DNA glycosylase n=2 Tax=Psilocybe cubensis TaxID=181762 RepID=A0ACB8HHB7_PSICU|nr:Uracil-DNA glycosylase [Psilocybe cubensis]KAH9487057.1 Uracil-DNA glycosylase [Psilocybe cubensis]
MPKDTSKGDTQASSVPDVLAVESTVTVERNTSARSATKASTLTELWGKKTTETTKTATNATTKTKKAAASTKNPSAEEAQSNGSTNPPSSSTGGPSKTLVALTRAILDSLEKDTMEESWRNVLAAEFQKSYFTALKKFLLTECTSYTVYPSVDNIYSWSRLTPLDRVKVVILGQDPYHDVGQAHGLSFSVLAPTKPPPSLKNIYKQLEADFPGFKTPKSGDLTPIAKQGVLWLNTSLTVRAHNAGSHAKKGWEIFTTQVIRAVLNRKNVKQGVVFMAWGLPAQKTFTSIGIDQTKHLLLQSAHPSPLSAHRGFLGNEHFRKANEWLNEKYGKEAEIDWMVLSSNL